MRAFQVAFGEIVPLLALRIAVAVSRFGCAGAARGVAELPGLALRVVLAACGPAAGAAGQNDEAQDQKSE
jgi:hypothetical protein